MTSRVSHTSIDCRDAFALSQWWKQVLGYVDEEDDPNLPGHDECMIVSPDGSHRLLFIEVPEPKTVKNRLHLDLVAIDGTRDAETERVLALGATPVAEHRVADGRGWLTMADPEGNEFCVVRSPEEREAAGT